MTRDITDFLENILAYSEKANDIVNKVDVKSLTEFSTDSLAIVRCLEVIGEATKQIPDKIREQYPEIPWKKVAGLRDILIHKYWSADMNRLVETVKEFIPPLRKVVKQILKDLNSNK